MIFFKRLLQSCHWQFSALLNLNEVSMQNGILPLGSFFKRPFLICLLVEHLKIFVKLFASSYLWLRVKVAKGEWELAAADGMSSLSWGLDGVPDVAFRASIQSLANEAHSPVCAHLPVSVSQSQALSARELCKYNSEVVTRWVYMCVCVCVCVWCKNGDFFPEMGEAEAPAPPPAVAQNPIKIFISGNNGNKEVRAVQQQSSGRKVSSGFYIFYMGHSGRFLARWLSWTAAKNFLHFPNPIDKTPLPVNFHLKSGLSDCICDLMTTNVVFIPNPFVGT